MNDRPKEILPAGEVRHNAATSGQNVQKWKGRKMSRKNGKKLLIAITVGAVVVKAVRDVRKAKRQEEALKAAFDDFYEEELKMEYSL